jgi:3-hydroxyacyl-CoA dehydrogenase / enoyl-CoA hydratase / 3-hydroxybutyryl-CoA epimerase
MTQAADGRERARTASVGGLSGFVARARELAERYGDRFEPPASLVEKAERGEIYSDEEALVST